MADISPCRNSLDLYLAARDPSGTPLLYKTPSRPQWEALRSHWQFACALCIHPRSSWSSRFCFCYAQGHDRLLGGWEISTRRTGACRELKMECSERDDRDGEFCNADWPWNVWLDRKSSFSRRSVFSVINSGYESYAVDDKGMLDKTRQCAGKVWADR